MLGTIGEILLLTAFVACGVSAVAFFWAARTDADVHTSSTWKRAGRWAWGAMSTAVGAASGVLWYMILTHQYQYAYVYQQSSNDLPGHYLFSTFWAGQEGSFLFWALMMCVVGGASYRLRPAGVRDAGDGPRRPLSVVSAVDDRGPSVRAC
jgi:cytochrome c-type biogenesis protein CcmF